VTVVGQKPNGVVVQRTVTPREFFEAWGPLWAKFLWQHGRDKTITVDGHVVRVVLHD
jgi:hypothetical protein